MTDDSRMLDMLDTLTEDELRERIDACNEMLGAHVDAMARHAQWLLAERHQLTVPLQPLSDALSAAIIDGAARSSEDLWKKPPQH